MLDELSDILIHSVNHGSVESHSHVHFPLLFDAQRVPRNVIALRQFPLRINQPDFNLPFEPLLAELIPSHHVFSHIFLDFLLMGVEGPMRRGIGEVEEEWPVLFRLLFREKLYRVVGESVRRVKASVGCTLRILDRLIPEEHSPRMFRIEKIRRAR